MKFTNKKTMKDKKRRLHLGTTNVSQVDKDDIKVNESFEVNNIEELNMEKKSKNDNHINDNKGKHHASSSNKRKNRDRDREDNDSVVGKKRHGGNSGHANHANHANHRRGSPSPSDDEGRDKYRSNAAASIKKRSIDSRDEYSGSEQEDMPYPQKTSKPLDSRHSDKKGNRQ